MRSPAAEPQMIIVPSLRADVGHTAARKEMLCQPILLIEMPTSNVVILVLGAQIFLDIELA